MSSDNIFFLVILCVIIVIPYGLFNRKARQNARKIQLAQDVREYEEFIEYIKRDLEQFKQSNQWEDMK